MAGTLLRANAHDLLHVGLDEVLFKKYKEKTPVYTKIYDQRSSTRKYEKTSGFSGFGSLVLKEEGVNISYDDPLTSLIADLKSFLINGENLKLGSN